MKTAWITTGLSVALLGAAWLVSRGGGGLARKAPVERAEAKGQAASPASTHEEGPAPVAPVPPTPDAPALGRELPVPAAARRFVDVSLAGRDLRGALKVARLLAKDDDLRVAMVPELWARWQAADASSRLRIVSMLAALGDPKATAMWQAMATADPDPAIREALLLDLPSGDPIFRETAMRSFASDPSEAVRRAGLRALPSEPSPGELKVLVDRLALDPSEAVKEDVARALAAVRSADPAPIAALSRIAQDGMADGTLRKLAWVALQRTDRAHPGSVEVGLVARLAPALADRE